MKHLGGIFGIGGKKELEKKYGKGNVIRKSIVYGKNGKPTKKSMCPQGMRRYPGYEYCVPKKKKGGK